ncbi:hypothetical protein BHE74_00040549 [Ensete ventricosum]|nr:hypothetical protein GW17_00028208 [Ensete ventricosum]RWW52993.1 hypothetical protein BHE74_00040549 [Ensete ventricosum]
MTIPPSHHLSAAVRWDHGCRHPTKTPIDCSTPVKSFNDFAAAERRSEEDSKEGGLPARIPQSGILHLLTTSPYCLDPHKVRPRRFCNASTLGRTPPAREP